MVIDVRRSQMQPEYSFVRATNNFLYGNFLLENIFFICKLEVQGHAEARHQTGNPSGRLCLLYSGGVPPSWAPMQRHNNGEGCHRCLVFSDAFCTALYKFDNFQWQEENFWWKNFLGEFLLISFTLYQCSQLLEPFTQRMEGNKGKTLEVSSDFLSPGIYFRPITRTCKSAKIESWSRLGTHVMLSKLINY